MQLSSAAAEKEKAFFEEIKIANLHFQTANNELTRLSVNFEQSKSESQAFQAERDKLVQENGRLAQSDAAHELKVQALSQDVEKREVTTYGSLLWDSLMQSMPGDGKATVTRYQGLGKAKQ
jgi:hypothetical protein